MPEMMSPGGGGAPMSPPPMGGQGADPLTDMSARLEQLEMKMAIMEEALVGPAEQPAAAGAGGAGLAMGMGMGAPQQGGM